MYAPDPKAYVMDPAAAYKTVKIKHPAAKFWTLALLFLVFVFLLSLIAIFVPWARKFDTPVAGSTSWISLFSSSVNTDTSGRWTSTIWTNDLDVSGVYGLSVTGGDAKCKGYFMATQALTIITCVMSFLAIVLVALILKKIWFKPAGMAVCTILWTILTLGVAIAAWACFLVYGEIACPGLTGAPTQGYSWGFIQMCCASGFALIASIFMCLGFMKLKKQHVPQASPMVDYPVMSTSPYMMY